MIACILIMATRSLQIGQATITYANPRMTLASFCQVLSEASKLSFSAPGSVGNTWITVSLNKVPITNVLKHLEQATATKLHQYGTQFRLTPDNKEILKADKQESTIKNSKILRLAKDLKYTMTEMLSSLPIEPMDSAYVRKNIVGLEQLDKLNAKSEAHSSSTFTSNDENDLSSITFIFQSFFSPVAILGKRLFCLLSPISLAQIPVGSSVVYSSNPSPVERAFPAGVVDNYVSQYLTDQSAWSMNFDARYSNAKKN